MNEALKRAFDAEAFRRLGRQLVDQLADYLSKAVHRDLPAVLPWNDPDALVERWPDVFPEDGTPDLPRDLKAMMETVIAQSNHLHHPKYVGHQVTSPLPQAAVVELASTLLNNAMAVYEMGPVGTAMERSLIRWMGTQLGFDRGQCDGVFTSGGSAGNLTALLAARQDRAGFDAWKMGDRGGQPLAILAGESAHYSVRRAVQIMGWGEEGFVPVPVDAQFKLRPECLEDALAERGGAGGEPSRWPRVRVRRRRDRSIRWSRSPSSATSTSFGCTSMARMARPPASRPGIGTCLPASSMPTRSCGMRTR